MVDLDLLPVTVEEIITFLDSPTVEKIGLLLGVEDELESLMDTISTIKDVHLDAGEKQLAAGDRAVTRWLKKLEDAIYDADDLLDDISANALRREIMTHDKNAKQVRIFFSESNQLASHIKMAFKIKAIRKRLDAINADRQFHLEVRHVETRVGNRERYNTHSFVREEAVVGREGDKKAVIHRLLDFNDEEGILILPIVGIGGLGKTTLAQLIFNDIQIQKHFNLKMWVCVSDIFDVKNIVEKILESATKKKPETVEMDTLIGYLKEQIDHKKYLLVLDDVWNENKEKWFCLKEVLGGGARGSRILVTTRNESVVRTIRSQSFPRLIRTVESYSLMGLDIESSWSLFKHMAFEGGQEPVNSSIVAIGKDILKKCSGVPLAITTIGSLLCFKNSEEEWLSFKKNGLSKIFDQNENGILPTLKLSYDHLPSHLKHCFAYCGLFPKDYKIDRSILIKLWIAQGFVKSSDNQNRCLEEVGNEYFMNLLWRSFFQEVETDEFGNVIQCKMHNLMHDLALSVAGSLITTLDDDKRNIDEKRNIGEKARHVSFVGNCDTSSISTFLCKPSRIRTFLLPGVHYSGTKFDCDAIFSSSKFLRVLDLNGRSLDSLPSSIGKLKHLRYLDLSKHSIEELPNSITELQNLQTLRLSKCNSLKKLPRDIKKLVNLRHLEIDDCDALTYMPHGLGQLANLQTLSRFVVHSGSPSKHTGGLKELNELNNLRGKLVIKELGHEKGVALEYKAANLKEKQHLHALELWWSNEGSVNDSDVVEDEMSLEGFQPHQNLKQFELWNYRGSTIPRWLLSLTNLVTFKLNSCLKCRNLPPLSQLPSLKYLALFDLDAMEYISEDGDSNEFASSSMLPFFPSLKEIWLEFCPNLKGWWRRDFFEEVNSDGHNSVEITEHRSLLSFPCLSTLKIKDCPMLTSMPMFPHLEEKLYLDNASSKPLQQTMMMNVVALQSPMSIATTSSSSTPLSKLKSMKLSSIMDLETLPLQNLTSLESLSINNCHELELAYNEYWMQGGGLTSLLSLSLSNLPKLVSLPSCLQHATTLQKVEIRDCESLTAIPEWIYNCKSLQVLGIYGCLSLASLPEGMRRLMFMQSLTIERCPMLLQRCEEDTGEDRAKIAHIPELDLRYSPQQEENSMTYSSWMPQQEDYSGTNVSITHSSRMRQQLQQLRHRRPRISGRVKE